MKAIPDKIKSFVQETNQNGRAIWYVQYLDVNRNKPVLRTFAYQNSAKKGLRVQEVVREYMDHNEVNDCLYFTYVSGYHVLWKGERSKSYYYYCNPDYKFKDTKMWRPNLYCSMVQTKKEIIEIMSKVVPYFHISEDAEIQNLMEYARIYKSNPRLELLSKAGLSYLYSDKMLMKCNNSRMKQISAWLRQNIAYATKYHPNYKFIIMALKYGETGEQCAERCMIMNDIKYMSSHDLNYTYEEMLELRKYLKKQNSDITTYRDYLRMSKQLHRDLNDYSVKFPRMLVQQHDALQELISAETNKEIDSKLNKKYKKFSKFVSELGKFKIVVPKTTSEFVKWGKALHICVGSIGYNRKMAEGACIILGVFMGDKIIECCELSKKYEIVQLRGDHNQPSEHHKKAETLVNMFIKNAQLRASC